MRLASRETITPGKKIILTCLVCWGLGACADLPKITPRPDLPSLPTATSTGTVTPVAKASTAPAIKSEPGKAEKKLIYYRGITGSLSETAPDEDMLEGRTLSLTFVNAPVADVARAVLSEALEQPLTIADGVTGSITLTAPTPVPAAEALSALETVLAESSLTLVKTNLGYLLTRISNAGSRAQPFRNAQGGYVGFGVTIVPVQYAAPGELADLIRPFVSERVSVTVDDKHSALVLRGTQTEVASAVEAIGAFDTPYLTDRIFGLFQLQYANAETIREEIDKILNAAGADTQAQLIALPRLNLLFVTSRTEEGFREARGWVKRLDQPSGGDERRLRYYAIQNTPAKVLASQLNAALGVALQHSAPQAQSAPSQASTAAQRDTRSESPHIASGSDRATIATDELNNALIIHATDQEYREILELLSRMDVQSPQVLIEATIAEVTLNNELNYGVRWFFNNAESTVTLSDNAGALIAPTFPGLGYKFFATNVQAALNTLATVTDVTVLSSPSIMVLNNQSAHLQVGDEVPIVTQTARSVNDDDSPIVSSVQLRETGVILQVKPRINASETVVLEVTQEVSDVTPTTSSGIDSPTIQQRRFTSTVAVKNNGTVALGGLIRETFTDNESGVPVLKDIPWLGYVFKSRDIIKRRTELIIFLTPRIIRNDADARNAIRFIRREMDRMGKDLKSPK